MIISTSKYLVAQGSRDKVMQFAMKARAFALTVDGNVDYCPMPSPYNDSEIISIEIWKEQKYLDEYRKAPQVKEFQNSRKPYFVVGSMEHHVYEATELPE